MQTLTIKWAWTRPCLKQKIKTKNGSNHWRVTSVRPRNYTVLVLSELHVWGIFWEFCILAVALRCRDVLGRIITAPDCHRCEIYPISKIFTQCAIYITFVFSKVFSPAQSSRWEWGMVMVASWYDGAFRFTGPLWWEPIGHQGILVTNGPIMQ